MHSFQKILFLVSFFLCSHCLFGQSFEILKLSNHKNFQEHNSYLNDSTLLIKSEVCYDKKMTIDEEYCYRLELTFNDTAGLLHRRIDIRDSSAVKCLFHLFSIWNWVEENVTVIGNFTFLSITDRAIKLNLNFKVRDNRRQQTYVYKGERTFTKTR
jgi:hypothetical protein